MYTVGSAWSAKPGVVDNSNAGALTTPTLTIKVEYDWTSDALNSVYTCFDAELFSYFFNVDISGAKSKPVFYSVTEVFAGATAFDD